MRKVNLISIVLVCFVVSLISVSGFAASLGESCDFMNGPYCDDSYCSSCEGSGICQSAMPDCGGDYCPEGDCDDYVPDCSEGSIGAECYCGGSPYTSGYCCSGTWQSEDCNAGGSVCGNGICDSDETYNACPQDCGGTESQSCSEMGGSCCNSGTYCDTSDGGHLVGQANDCVVCCADGNCVSDSETTGSCGDYSTSGECNDASCKWCADDNGCYGTDHTCGDIGSMSCSVDTDCYGCPVEYSRLTTNGKCINGECTCCANDNDCQPDHTCQGGYCMSGNDPCEWDNCPGYCCSGSDDPCPSDNCPGYCCQASTGDWCGYHSDGVDNYCSDNQYCADSGKAWCCPHGTKVCPGDPNGNCVNFCEDENRVCGNAICEPGETTENCHDDCPNFTGMQNVPENCWVSRNRFGKEFIECEKKNFCPPNNELAMVKEQCISKQGTPIEKIDKYNGCKFVHCEFNKYVAGGDCPTEAQNEKAAQDCFDMGMNPVPVWKGGGGFGSGPTCEVIDCLGKGIQHGPHACAEYENPGIRLGFIDQCGGIEGTMVVFDDNDPQCLITKCQDTTSVCAKELPEGAYDRCPGDLIFDRDEETGCITKFDCVWTGGGSDVTADDVKNIPSGEKLLSLAVKFKGLDVKLIQLADEMENFKLFYEGQAEKERAKGTAEGDALAEEYDLEAKRFVKVMAMLKTAGAEVTKSQEEFLEIAAKDELTKLDALKAIKILRRLKEEQIRPIIFAMLGNVDKVADEYKIDVDATTATEADLTDIENNGDEFMKALTTCSPVAFYPDGENMGPKVMIKGLDGDDCIMYVDMTEEMQREMERGDGPNDAFIELVARDAGITLQTNSAGDYILDMTCRIPDYTKGIDEGPCGPKDEWLEERCTGIMVQMMKMGPKDDCEGGPDNRGPPMEGGPYEPGMEGQYKPGMENEWHPECGDGACDWNYGEDEMSCPADCQKDYNTEDQYYENGEYKDWREDYAPPEGEYYEPEYPEGGDYQEPVDNCPDDGCPGYCCPSDQGGDYYPPEGGDQYPSDGGDYYPEGGDYQPPEGGEPTNNPCPDGFCDEWEQQGGQCIEDCGY